MRAMPEVSVEDSISRRGSSHSTSSSSSRNGRTPRPNSHTQHAAAIAAANVGQPTGGLSGPRPPPPTVKEARPWNFTSFDHRTKEELAASVTAATQTSEARHHVGGPRALAVSEKAMQTGVLPPPVCFEPKVVQQQQQIKEENKENGYAAASRTPSQASSGTWRKDWSNLAAETGYQSTPTTPASTPGIGSYGSFKAANRCLSPVVEESRRLSGAVQQASIPTGNPVYRPRQLAPQLAPAPLSTASSRTRCFAPSCSSSSYSYNSTQPSSSVYSNDNNSASMPRPPPPAASDPRATGMSPARVRLMRAQEALKVRGGAKDTVVMLKRPPRLTGDGRPSPRENQPRAAPTRPEYLRMPGSFEDY